MSNIAAGPCATQICMCALHLPERSTDMSGRGSEARSCAPFKSEGVCVTVCVFWILMLNVSLLSDVSTCVNANEHTHLITSFLPPGSKGEEKLVFCFCFFSLECWTRKKLVLVLTLILPTKAIHHIPVLHGWKHSFPLVFCKGHLEKNTKMPSGSPCISSPFCE